MKTVVLDNMLPSRLATVLRSWFVVAEARTRGWDEIGNGTLLGEAERAEFNVLLTADQSIKSQQNLKNRTIAVVELGAQQWEHLEAYIERIVAAVNAATPGSFTQVKIPLHRMPCTRRKN